MAAFIIIEHFVNLLLIILKFIKNHKKLSYLREHWNNLQKEETFDKEILNSVFESINSLVSFCWKQTKLMKFKTDRDNLFLQKTRTFRIPDWNKRWQCHF